MTSSVENLASQPIVAQLGWTLIHFLWQAMVVSALAAVVLRVFRRASSSARYTALCFGLFAMAAAPVVTFIVLQTSPVENTDGGSTSAVSAMRMPAAGPTFLPGTSDETSDQPDRNVRPRPTLELPAPGTSGSTIPRPADSRQLSDSVAPSPQTRVHSALPWIVAGWISGVVLLSVWHLAGWLLARRLTTRGTRPVGPAAQAVLAELMQRMKIRGNVRLLESTRAAVPLVVGWLRPVLAFPVSVLSGLPPEQLRAILAHELAHVRRHDFLINVLQTIVETCLFYHPAVWWLSRRIRIEREYCADDEAAAVCQDRESYARALVSLADSVTVAPTTAVAATGGSLASRIRRLLGMPSRREPVLRRPSLLISAVLALAVICGLFVSTQSSARQPGETQPERTPIKVVASQLEKSTAPWKLHEVDAEPSVMVDGHRGFRVVLRRTWKEYSNLGKQQQAAAPSPTRREPQFKVKTADWEFVLVPVQPERAPSKLKSQIKWKKSRSPYHTRDVCMGEGHGYVWFTHGTVFNQEHVRDRLKLDGGDDRIQLAMDGLIVRDPGTNTANSCMQIPAKFGDRSLPYIQRTIDQTLADPGEINLWKVVGCLAHIRTDRSTEMLLRLFEHDELGSAAEYALIHVPYRRKAKRAYFEMLRRQSRVNHGADACVEFQWRDAVPVLRDVIARPRHLAYLRYAIPARRTLEGSPIAEKFFAAERTLLSTRNDRDPERKEVAAALRLLIESDDSEAANLMALALVRRTGKGDFSWVNQRGIAILKSRPRQSTLAFLKSIEAGIHANSRPQIQKILTAVFGREQAKAPPSAIQLQPQAAQLRIQAPTGIPSDPARTQPVPAAKRNRVVDAQGRPVAKAKVELMPYRGGSDKAIATTFTDERGEFDYPPGTPDTELFRVNVYADGFKADDWIGNRNAFRQVRGTRQLDTLDLHRPATIAGTVLGRNGKPLPNAQVAVDYFQDQGAACINCIRLKTDANGRFKVQDVWPGNIFVRYETGTTKTVGNQPGILSIAHFKAGDGEVVDDVLIDLRKSRCELAGRITDHEGNGIEGRWISATLASAKGRLDESISCTTDKDGRFRFTGLPADEFVVGTYTPGFQTTVKLNLEKPTRIELFSYVRGKPAPADRKQKLVWGETGSNGIATALKLDPSRKAYAIGERIGVRVIARNTGEKPQLLKHTFSQFTDLLVLPEDGAATQHINYAYFTGIAVERIFKIDPGHEVTLGYFRIELLDSDSGDTSTGGATFTINTAPGKTIRLQANLSHDLFSGGTRRKAGDVSGVSGITPATVVARPK